MYRTSLFLIAILCVAPVFGQENEGMRVLESDLGQWECAVRLYTDPNAEPETSKAQESSHKIGEMWVVGEFKGEMFGSPFHGASQFTYDAIKKKYIGTWIDSSSPNMTKMEGTWDAKSKTLTMFGTAQEPTGDTMKTKLVTQYKEADTRTMTMYMAAPGGGDDWIKMMVVDYTRKK